MIKIAEKSDLEPTLAKFSSFKPPQQVIDKLQFRKQLKRGLSDDSETEVLESSISGVQYSGPIKKTKTESSMLQYAVGIYDKAANTITLHPINQMVDLNISIVSENEENEEKYRNIFGATKQQKRAEREREYSASTRTSVITKPIRANEQKNLEAKNYLPPFTDFKTSIRQNVFPLSLLLPDTVLQLPIAPFVKYLNMETTLEEVAENLYLSPLTQYLLKDFYESMQQHSNLVYAVSFIHFATTPQSTSQQATALVQSLFDSSEPGVLKTKIMIQCIILALHITGFTFNNIAVLVNTFKLSAEKLIDILKRVGFSANADGEIKLKAPFGRSLQTGKAKAE